MRISFLFTLLLFITFIFGCVNSGIIQENQSTTNSEYKSSKSTSAQKSSIELDEKAKIILDNMNEPLVCIVKIHVLPNGFVDSVQIEKSSGFVEIDSAIINTVKKWRFTPSSENKSAYGTIKYIIRKDGSLIPDIKRS